MKRVSYPFCECSRCTWTWVAKTQDLPKRCANPKCRSPYWRNTTCVYVIRGKDFEKDCYKIGCTDNYNRRIGSTMIPILVAKIYAKKIKKYELEYMIHNLFEEKRVGKGEIFRLNKSDLNKIRKISRSNDPLKEINKYREKDEKKANKEVEAELKAETKTKQ